jgi:MFS family permease
MPDMPVLPASNGNEGPSDVPWYELLNRYHWFVFVVAVLGWMFDCLDQQLFILARQPAMKELLTEQQPQIDEETGEVVVNEETGDPVLVDVTPAKGKIDSYSAYATSIFLMGWATGGLFFGVLGDRIGRAKTMLLTILLYSLFTGLSALSQNFWDFCLYRFLTGLGVGGEFAVGVALVAEVMPQRARPYVLSLLQALSAVGNISAALISIGYGQLDKANVLPDEWGAWRPLFVVGAVPALLALVIRRHLKEPERWQQAAHKDAVAKQLGSYRALFGHPVWKKHALLGLALAFSGVVGLWGVGFFTMDLVGNVLTPHFEEAYAEEHGIDYAAWPDRKEAINSGTAEASQPEQEYMDAVGASVTTWKGNTSLMINIGAFFGMFGFGLVTSRIGRKPTFVIALIAAFVSTVVVYYFLHEFWQVFVLVPIMGFCQLSLFAGYAIYFPELFPTHLRSTGTSFCYNVGRFVAAVGPYGLGMMTTHVYDHTDEPLRWSGLTMCGIFIIGLVVLPFLPETKDQPLPE